jgi:hypothetical protein
MALVFFGEDLCKTIGVLGGDELHSKIGAIDQPTDPSQEFEVNRGSSFGCEDQKEDLDRGSVHRIEVDSFRAGGEEDMGTVDTTDRAMGDCYPSADARGDLILSTNNTPNDFVEVVETIGLAQSVRHGLNGLQFG